MSEEEDYRCRICEQSFISKEDISNHMKMHNKKVCNECGESNLGITKGLCRKCYAKNYAKTYKKESEKKQNVPKKGKEEIKKWKTIEMKRLNWISIELQKVVMKRWKWLT